MYENNYNSFFEKVTDLLNEAFGSNEKEKTNDKQEETVSNNDYSYYHTQKYVNDKLVSEDKVEVVNGKKTVDEHFESEPKIAEVGCNKKKCNCGDECRKSCDKKCASHTDNKTDVEIEFQIIPSDEDAETAKQPMGWHEKWLSVSYKYDELRERCDKISKQLDEITKEHNTTKIENARLKEQNFKLEAENRKLENKLATLKNLLEK